jgi:hypothetical protein
MSILDEITAHGYARLPALLDARDCEALIELFDRDASFRKTIEMERHAYGQGRYRYFADPLPESVESLRSRLYSQLLPVARVMSRRLGLEDALPGSLEELRERCRAAGQTRPTCLLLHYTAGGYNRMHQDVYGAVSFPLQVVVLLSPPEAFEGGEFLVSESRPRMQTRTEALSLARGEGIVFANTLLPVPSRRGFARARMRHGLNRIRSGERYALGLIFHDAE